MPPPIIWNLSDCGASSVKCWDWHTGKSRIHHAGTLPPTYWSHVVVWDLCDTSNLNGDSHLAFPFRVSDLHCLCEGLDVWLTHEGREGVQVPSSSLCLVIPLPRMPFYPHCSANSIHRSGPSSPKCGQTTLAFTELSSFWIIISSQFLEHTFWFLFKPGFLNLSTIEI